MTARDWPPGTVDAIVGNVGHLNDPACRSDLIHIGGWTHGDIGGRHAFGSLVLARRSPATEAFLLVEVSVHAERRGEFAPTVESVTMIPAEGDAVPWLPMSLTLTAHEQDHIDDYTQDGRDWLAALESETA